MRSSSSFAFRPGLTLMALAGAVVACRAPAPQVTALRVVSSWTNVTVDQLEFSLFDSTGKALFPAQIRPSRPGGPLASGVDSVSYFADALGGNDVRCAVRALQAGKTVATAQMQKLLVARAMVTLPLTLVASPGSKSDGASCSDGEECVSALCVDGVCCHTEC